jgi:hypothetical protein
VSGVEFQLVRIPAGEFQMGSQNQSEETEIPRHLVRLRTLILLVEEPFTTEGTEDTEENQTNRGSRLRNNSRFTQPSFFHLFAASALR